MTGPMLHVVAVFCPQCKRGQIMRVDDAPATPQPCWWCRHNVVVGPRRPLDAPGKIAARDQ